MKKLLTDIRQCSACSQHLAHGTRPVLAAHIASRILIIGQAPGRIVHETGVPWDDKSGDNLRTWLNIDKEVFYDERKVALVPMGFCYPGTGKSGDLLPRSECAPLWHELLLTQMKHVQLTLLIGSYAQQYYLGEKARKTLTATVMNFRDYLPEYLVLPHPSPRNNIWRAKNAWFDKDVIPVLREKIQNILY